MNFDRISFTESNIQSPSSKIFSSNNSQRNKRNIIKVDFDILSNMDRTKFVDSSINKYYTKYLQKQAFIQQEQKIYEIIEKTDEPKIFNSLRANYIKEMNELKNMNNIIKDKGKVTDIISSVNLFNFKKKLYSMYKLSGDDLGFMTSFMNHLGNRPKIIHKPKVNKKLEALSMGKLGNFLRKKEKDKKEKNLNKTNNINNKNYLKLLLKKLDNDNISNRHNINNFNNEEKSVIEKTEVKNEIYKNNNIQKDKNKSYLKKKTMNVHSTNMKLFRNSDNNVPNYTTYSSSKKITGLKKYSVNYTDLYKKFKAKSKEESLNEDNKEEKKEKNFEISEYANNKKPLSKFNNIITTTDTNVAESNFRDTIIKKVNIDFNKNKEEKENEYLIDFYNEDNSSKDNDNKNEKDFTASLENSKKIDNNEEKNKILKLYKTSMNEFLQMVKQEGNIMNKTCHKLSSLLYKLKKETFETFQNERNKNKNQNLNQKNYKTVYNKNDVEEKLNDNKFGKKKMGKTFYQSVEKSRYRIPYINKVVYGENNLYDPFEKLQKELFNEVKMELMKAEIANKKKKKKVKTVVGIDILHKLIREDSEDEMKKELNKLINNQDKIAKSINRNKERKNTKTNEINKSSNKKNI